MSLLLILAMVAASCVSVFGSKLEISNEKAHVYTEEEYAALDEDVFGMIAEIEDAAQADIIAAYGENSYMKRADYAALIPQVIEAIEASDTYVRGTLQQNGDFLVWQTKAGIPCCYSPRMEAKLHQPSKYTDDEIAAFEADAQRWGAELMSSLPDSVLAVHSPTSTSIGLIQPYWESSSSYSDVNFLSYSPYYKSMWQTLYTATEGEGVRYSMKNATVDNIARTMEQCGIVIFDSHGATDYENPYDEEDFTSKANSSYLCLTTNSGITSTDTRAKTGPYGTYYDCLRGSGYAYVNGTCIANHMTSNAPESLLYMGICLGMATDKMFSGLRDKGVEVVYGYSQSVSFYGEKLYMQSILGNVKNGDSFATAVSKAKTSYGNWDPAYDEDTFAQAVADRAAFPIVVSSEDVYPGHGNVDALQTVYSTWRLFGDRYTVTAVSNNTSYGTVSVNGYTITATPKTGYYVSGYTVTSGTATVEQNGNVFTVTPSSDCTVRINFAAKTAVKITCVANGLSYRTLNGYAGEAIALPSTATAVNGWTFAGWSTGTVAETTAEPEYYAPGESITVNANTTLYAVYTGVKENGGSETVYELLTTAPSNWAGDYVITGDASASKVLKGLSGSRANYEMSSNGGAEALSETGMTLSGGVLRSAEDSYVFTAAPSGSYFTFRNKATGSYLAAYRDMLYSYGTFSAAYCRWAPSADAYAMALRNPAGSRYPYTGFSSGVFKLMDSTQPGIYLWKAATRTAAATVYTTSPSAGSTQPVDPDPGTQVRYTVSFSVPSGVSAVASRTVDAGASFTLPSASAPSGYTFVGWVADNYDYAGSRPSSVLTGSYTPAGSITLSALYSHTSNAKVYELVTAAPADWSGNYVVTYGKDGNMYAMKGLSGTTKYESVSAGGAKDLASAGMTLSGSVLSNAQSDYVFTMEASGSGYTLKNSAAGTYLISRSGCLYSSPAFSSASCLWTPSMNGEAVNLRNNAGGKYPFLSFSSLGHFIVNGSSGNCIYLWREAPGSTATLYTTVIH